MTVRGTIRPTEMGWTLIHEHILSAGAGFSGVWPHLFGGRETLVGEAERLLGEAQAEGVQTLVDATTMDLGRDIELLETVSARVGLNIVASTGHWLDPSRATLARSREELEEVFVMELSEGIEGSGIRAGVIKVANEGGVEGFGERLLRAASGAWKVAGVPIITHTDGQRRTGIAQADIFESESVDPSSVVIGHSDDSADIGYLVELCHRGFWLGMDRLSLGAVGLAISPRPTDARLEMLVKLIELGLHDHVLLSHDEAVYLGSASAEMQLVRRQRMPYGFCFLAQSFLPALRGYGVDEKIIRDMLIDNPRRLFARESRG
jgi:phosphotriesterase-related protein